MPFTELAMIYSTSGREAWSGGDGGGRSSGSNEEPPELHREKKKKSLLSCGSSVTSVLSRLIRPSSFNEAEKKMKRWRQRPLTFAMIGRREVGELPQQPALVGVPEEAEKKNIFMLRFFGCEENESLRLSLLLPTFFSLNQTWFD